MVERRILQHYPLPLNLQDLKRCIANACYSLDVNELHKLVDSMPKRIRENIRTKCGQIKLWSWISYSLVSVCMCIIPFCLQLQGYCLRALKYLLNTFKNLCFWLNLYAKNHPYFSSSESMNNQHSKFYFNSSNDARTNDSYIDKQNVLVEYNKQCL